MSILSISSVFFRLLSFGGPLPPPLSLDLDGGYVELDDCSVQVREAIFTGMDVGLVFQGVT